MSKNAASIPNFICNYFRFMSDIVRIVNKDGDNYLTHEQLQILADRDSVPITTLLKLRIAREIDDVYEIDKRVVNFVAFSNNEFALSSPESVKKFHYSLSGLYEKLLRSTETNDTIMHADHLISELRDFTDILDSSITRLLNDTLDLKENSQQFCAKERFDMASSIIKEYVEPLNEIVEDRPDTILPLIRNISSLAMQKSISYDKNVENKMRRLRIQANIVHENTELFGRKIISELFTLRKIKKTNSILSGAISWLEKQDNLIPKGLCNRFPIKVHSKEFFFETIEELEILLEGDTTVDIPTKDELHSMRMNSNYFHFDKSIYIDKLGKSLPVKNIFHWIHKEMKANDELSYENYCIALSLLDELHITYSKAREILIFDTCKLNIPVAEATNIL